MHKWKSQSWAEPHRTHAFKKKKKKKQESQEVQAEKVRQKSGDRTRGFQEQRHSGRVE